MRADARGWPAPAHSLLAVIGHALVEHVVRCEAVMLEFLPHYKLGDGTAPERAMAAEIVRLRALLAQQQGGQS